MIEDVAQVDEMLLRGGSLLQFHLAPLGDEFGYGHNADSVAPGGGLRLARTGKKSGKRAARTGRL